MTAAAEDFQEENPDVRVTVGISGTGGGFERFCRGETDLSTRRARSRTRRRRSARRTTSSTSSSRSRTTRSTVVVNQENDWADVPHRRASCNAIWKPGSKIDNWNQVATSFPDVPLKLFGPGTDSGTFDYFTDAINGEEGASRTDYSASEDDNVIVQGVSGAKGGLGYFGFSYYEENAGHAEARSRSTAATVRRTERRDRAGRRRTRRSRPLFVYAEGRRRSQRAGVEAFIAVHPRQRDQRSPSRPSSCRSTAEQTRRRTGRCSTAAGGARRAPS